ncbi:hypothetical protein ETB97_009902 [Aspergillus alliaceus]|uniref:AMP-dependent synthetase/ligase domain-containing protein n=1 Tax=Petromyces alliaceus TaxID=209559 RepID=A0A8H6ECV6_PETAA|nr:hypothetical protein ETB97_009902 [Aspergillus burnettii]
MKRIVYALALQTSGAIAVIDGVIITYGELVVESFKVAQMLDEANTPVGEPIGIMLNPGILQVVAQLVVLLTGGTCVPIEPCFPKRRIKPMLQVVQDKHVIMHTRGALKLRGFNHIYLRNLGKHSTSIISNVEFVRLPNRSHKLFTSGSTGKPKPVSVRASSILHLATKTPATLLSLSD